MKITEALLTNSAYGYPRGAVRTHPVYVLAVLHQTANASADAYQERDYANRVGSMGPSATYYVDSDGSAVHAVNGTKYAAWGSGDLDHPNTAILTVSRIATDARVHGINANEAVFEQIECCGAGPEPYTDVQFESVAQLIAARARLYGLPIDRTTVLVHADLNSVDRASDPWPASTREARIARVIDRARKILEADMPLVSPTPDAPAAYIVDVAAGGSCYFDLACTQVAQPNPMLALPGVVTYGTANRPAPDHLLMRAIAHPSGFVTYVGAEKCTNLRPKSPVPTQTVRVTGQGLQITGP